MQFTVIGIERMGSGTAKIRLEAQHADTIYTSQLFLHVPWDQVKVYAIDSKHMLFPCLTTEVQPILGDLPTLQATLDATLQATKDANDRQ